MPLTILDCSRPDAPSATVATRDDVEAWVRAHAVGEPRAYRCSTGTGRDRVHLSFGLGGDFAGGFARRSDTSSLMFFLEENGEDTGEEVQVRWGNNDTQGALEVSRMTLDRLVEVLAHFLTDQDFPSGNWVQVKAW